MTCYDVTSLGSTMLRLSVPPGDRLETATSFDVRAAGTESNVMIALTRMGKRTAWVSRLADNPIGRRIARELASFGVDVSKIVWTDQGRNELYFMEYGAAPRPIQVVYDRKHAAITELAFDELDVAHLLNTRIVHLTGILAALSPKCVAAMKTVISRAKSAGVKISFDVNYRAKLWSAESARATLIELMRSADILLLTREDAEGVFGITGSAESVLDACRKEFGAPLCVLTLGSDGGIATDGSQVYRCKGYAAETIDRVGAGDAFAAGLLAGVLEGSIQTGMDYASAMAALKLGIRGDVFVCDRQEVLRVVHQTSRREVGR